MPHKHHFPDLQHFLDEGIFGLQVHVLACLVDGGQECAVVRRGQFNAREKIRSDTVEKRNIVSQELWQVDIDDGTQHENLLFFVRVPELQSSCSEQHGLNSAHAVVVVRLRRQLLGAKTVRSDNFH